MTRRLEVVAVGKRKLQAVRDVLLVEKGAADCTHRYVEHDFDGDVRFKCLYCPRTWRLVDTWRVE
jgi:hypothetical protein